MRRRDIQFQQYIKELLISIFPNSQTFFFSFNLPHYFPIFNVQHFQCSPHDGQNVTVCFLQMYHLHLTQQVLVLLSSREGQTWHLLRFFAPVSKGSIVGWSDALPWTFAVTAAAAGYRAGLARFWILGVTSALPSSSRKSRRRYSLLAFHCCCCDFVKIVNSIVVTNWSCNPG